MTAHQPSQKSSAIDLCKQYAYISAVIRTFRHKGLAEHFETGRTGRIDAKMHKRILARLDALDAATRLEDVNLPGFDFHSLRGFEPTRYTLHVNGPWCVTFQFDGTDVLNVDLEQYH